MRTSRRRRIRRTVAACRALVHSKAACGRTPHAANASNAKAAAAAAAVACAARPPLMICCTSGCLSAVVNMCRSRISMFVATRLLFHGFSEFGGPKYSGAAQTHHTCAPPFTFAYQPRSARATHQSWTSAALRTSPTESARRSRSPASAAKRNTAQHSAQHNTARHNDSRKSTSISASASASTSHHIAAPSRAEPGPASLRWRRAQTSRASRLDSQPRKRCC